MEICRSEQCIKHCQCIQWFWDSKVIKLGIDMYLYINNTLVWRLQLKDENNEGYVYLVLVVFVEPSDSFDSMYL